MNDTVRMPDGGYDIKIVRKEDIIKCIDSNILDKDIMLAFINQLELDAKNFIEQGRWTSLPYIGTIRRNQYKEISRSKEVTELIDAARDTLDRDKYLLFRKNLKDEIAISIKHERLYKYKLSQVVKKNRSFYNRIEKSKGEKIARVVCYSFFEISFIDYELQVTY